ncbi:MAG TPA: MBL fold metallo-hydrolase [Pseudonocardiaceae bacterium]|nr:MBL fold metallo-hydrolase [Pseudonocardiaceae bacterium]
MTGGVAVDVLADDPGRDWTVPGVYSVAPGVYRIPLPLPSDALKAVNVYAVLDGDDLVLIDSGWALDAAREALVAGLGGIGRGLGDVRRFLVTHLHQDHYTQAVALRREFGMEVALGKGEQPSLDVVSAATSPLSSVYIERLRTAGAFALVDRLASMPRPPRDPGLWGQPDEWLSDRATAAVGSRELTAVATPGHTRGHLVFVETGTALLFAGDHVLPHITPSIGFESAPADFPLRDYLDSLQLVRAMPDARLLPAHGRVTASAHQRVDELLEHHDRRLAQIEALIVAGAGTAYEAASRMTWTRRQRTLSELDPFNEMLAVLETMSHLDVLVLQGRLRRTDVDGSRHYQVG